VNHREVDDALDAGFLPSPGFWRLWTGERKGERGEHQLFAILTTESNGIVRPIHAKAMPVLLTAEHEWDAWLMGSIEDAIALQKPMADDLPRIAMPKMSGPSSRA
jgi:putative SOS response-associated peptidase YedK